MRCAREEDDAELWVYADVRAPILIDAARDGRPLVLAWFDEAQSRPLDPMGLFDAYRQKRPVFALELPCVSSNDPAEVLTDVLRMACFGTGEQAPDVVALWHCSAVAARVVARRPELVRSLATVMPSDLAWAARLAISKVRSECRPTLAIRDPRAPEGAPARVAAELDRFWRGLADETRASGTHRVAVALGSAARGR